MSDEDYKKFLKDPDFQKEVEKYKQEVLEGLQIEEEGLTDLLRKKTKHPSTHQDTVSPNDPLEGNQDFTNNKDGKHGQMLKFSNDQPTPDAKIKIDVEQVVTIPKNITDANDEKTKKQELKQNLNENFPERLTRHHRRRRNM